MHLQLTSTKFNTKSKTINLGNMCNPLCYYHFYPLLTKKQVIIPACLLHFPPDFKNILCLSILKTIRLTFKSLLDIKCVCHFSLQLLLETISAPINIRKVTLKMCTGMCVAIYVKISYISIMSKYKFIYMYIYTVK
jgi:hypothetical protein